MLRNSLLMLFILVCLQPVGCHSEVGPSNWLAIKLKTRGTKYDWNILFTFDGFCPKACHNSRAPQTLLCPKRVIYTSHERVKNSTHKISMTKQLILKLLGMNLVSNNPNFPSPKSRKKHRLLHNLLLILSSTISPPKQNSLHFTNLC